MDRCIDLAMAKSISEYVERVTFWQAEDQGKLHGLMSYRAEGYAAFPKIGFSDPVKKARDFSLLESVEKYSWPEFWHNQNIGFDREAGFNPWPAELAQLKIRDHSYIFPFIQRPWHVCISIGRIGENGVVLGAACSKDREKSKEHAFSEMLRKYIATNNIRNGFVADWPEWAERLMFLAEHGNSSYEKRLSSSEAETILLPDLELDGEVLDHPFRQFYHVYRTQFKGKVGYFGNQGKEVGYL